LVILSSLLITGLLFLQNVTARSHEIGLLKAMGKSSYSIMFMFLAKAFILGLTGGITGFLMGNLIAEYFGKEIFRFTAADIKPLWDLFFYTIVLFPVLWMLASWIPALKATQVDAARTLSQE